MKYVLLICSFVVSSNILLAASGGGFAVDASYDPDAKLARQLQDAEGGIAGSVYIPTSDVGTFVSQTAEGLKVEFAGRLVVLQTQVQDLQEQVSAQKRELQDLQEQVSAQKRELQDVRKLLFALMCNPSSSKQ
jgi:hypothetical protein